MNHQRQTFLTRTMARLLTLIFLFTTVLPPVTVRGAEPYQTTVTADGYSVTFSLDSRWDNSGNGTVTLHNTGAAPINGWILTFNWTGTITSCWNAVMEKGGDHDYTFKHDGWNSSIPAGQSVSFGFTAELTDDTPLPDRFQLPVAAQPVDTAGYTVTYQCGSDWGSGFESTITINNTGAAAYDDWVLAFDFGREIGLVWEGELLSAADGHYVIGNKGYNGTIPAGGSVTFGFNGTGGDRSMEPQNCRLTNTALITDPPETPGNETNPDETTGGETGDDETDDETGDETNDDEINDDETDDDGTDDDETDDDETNDDETNDDELTEEEQLLSYLRSLGYDSVAAADLDGLSIGYQVGDHAEQVTGDLTLPDGGTYGSAITWTSSEPEAINHDGTVTRADTAVTAVLTAAVDDGTVVLTKDFTVQVAPQPEEIVIEKTPAADLTALNGGKFPLIYYNEDKRAAYYIEGCYTAMKVTTAAEAVASLQTVDWLIGLGPDDEYRPKKVLSYDWGTVYRLGQYYQGIPLDGNEIIVTVDQTGTVTSLNSSHEPRLTVDTAAAIDEPAAVAAALAVASGGEPIGSELSIVRLDGEYRLGWVVKLDDIETETYPGGATFLVDARSGAILKSISATAGAMTPAPITGTPIAESAAAAEADSNGEITVDGSYDAKKEVYYYRDPVRNITLRDDTLKREFFGDKPIISSEGNPSEPKIEQNALTALYHVAKVYDFYLSAWGHRSYDGQGSELTIYLNDPMGSSWNSFSYKMDIGLSTDSNGTSASDAVALDIIAHEYTHAVFQNNAGIMMSDSTDYLAPAMEAYSDIIGAMIESVNSMEPEDHGDGKWVIGEDILNDGVRNIMVPGSLENPNNGRPYPSAVGEKGTWITKEEREAEDDLDFIHHNSTPVSHAAYLMSDIVGDPVELASLWYDSMGMLQLVREIDNPMNPQINDFTAIARAVLLAATARNYTEAQKEGIKAAFAQVGIEVLIDDTEILTEEDLKNIDGSVLWVALPHHTVPGAGSHAFVSNVNGTVYAWVSAEPYWLTYSWAIIADHRGSHYYDIVLVNNNAIDIYTLNQDGQTWKPYASYPRSSKHYNSRYELYGQWNALLYTVDLVTYDPKGAAQKGLTGHNGGTSTLFEGRTLMFY